MTNVFKTLLVCCSVFAAGSALSADLPRRSPAPAPVAAAPVFTWQGAYVGLQGGYQSGRTKGSLLTAAVTPYAYNTDGGVFGVHAGYNHQFNG